jgi:hypothetical protein
MLAGSVSVGDHDEPQPRCWLPCDHIQRQDHLGKPCTRCDEALGNQQAAARKADETRKRQEGSVTAEMVCVAPATLHRPPAQLFVIARRPRELFPLVMPLCGLSDASEQLCRFARAPVLESQHCQAEERIE